MGHQSDTLNWCLFVIWTLSSLDCGGGSAAVDLPEEPFGSLGQCGSVCGSVAPGDQVFAPEPTFIWPEARKEGRKREEASSTSSRLAEGGGKVPCGTLKFPLRPNGSVWLFGSFVWS